MKIGKSLILQLFSFSRRYFPGRLYKIRDILFKLFRLRIDNVSVLVDGIYYNIDSNNYHERGLLTFGAYEIGTTLFIRQYIKQLRGGVVIDVGANIGIHTLNMCSARDCVDVFVIALEPNPEIAARLRRNISINNFNNCKVFQCGASDVEEKLSLGLSYPEDVVGYHNPGIASMVQTERAVRFFDVECKTLDSLLNEIGHNTQDVKLIKLDIEGKELDALKGMRQILSASSAAIILEYNPSSFQEVLEYITGFNYIAIGSLMRYGIDTSVFAENILFLKKDT